MTTYLCNICKRVHSNIGPCRNVAFAAVADTAGGKINLWPPAAPEPHAVMSVDELVERARFLIEANQTAYVNSDTMRMANAIVHHLGQSYPCGYPEPEITPYYANATTEPPTSYRIDIDLALLDDADDARGYAAMILRRADEADTLTAKLPKKENEKP